MKELSKKQKDKLKKHSAHHTNKHMGLMRNFMNKGETFASAHKKAQRKVGT
tara:strand:+ start:508 stop:660 length:153 start_codon:yes stop_codon:yes gene_type:complete